MKNHNKLQEKLIGTKSQSEFWNNRLKKKAS
jgi:hypothetical protein